MLFSRWVWGFFQVSTSEYKAEADFTPGMFIAWYNRRREKVDKYCVLLAWGLSNTKTVCKERIRRVLLSYRAFWNPSCININTSAKAIPASATTKRLFSRLSCNQPKGVRR